MSTDREPRRNRDLQDYTDRFGRESEGRLSRRDEDVFAKQVAKQRELDSREYEGEVAGEAETTRVLLQHAVLDVLDSLDRLDVRLQGDLTSESRMIRHLTRRLRPSLRRLLNR